MGTGHVSLGRTIVYHWFEVLDDSLAYTVYKYLARDLGDKLIDVGSYYVDPTLELAQAPFNKYLLLIR